MRRLSLAALVLALPLTPLRAQETATHVIIVSGIGGEPQYQTEFLAWGLSMAKAAVERWGVPKSDVTFLAEQPEAAPGYVTGRSTKENVEQAFTQVAANAGPNDLVFVLLIGHGSFLNGTARINLPGPDLAAADFAQLVDKLGSRRVVLVNTASSSGEFLKAISGPNRIVITSTKSGMERNESRFARYFVQAFAEDGADTDKDGAVSMLEAFQFARREVQRSYEAQQALLTEHAVFDDNGDGRGSVDAAAGGDGATARLTFLGRGAVVAGAEAPEGASPQLRALYEQKRDLEHRIDALKAAKATMDPDAYQKQLEDLLLDLAQKSEEIRKLEGKS